MRLAKTEQAKAELSPGTRTLGQRERTLLLLADGHKTAPELAAFVKNGGSELVRQLVQDGYLAEVARTLHSAVAERPDPYAPVATPTQPTPVVAKPLTSHDAFDGKRSLATTRMFLFDMAERMFARRDPDMAMRLRNDLRDAKDREAMLAVSQDMLKEVEAVAGRERADSIRERIVMLLPALNA